jgi:predicted RNA-binding Zn ribbon-like protein
MAFDHDTVLSMQAAVTLVNSAEDPDTLTTPAELDAFYTGFGYTGRHTRDAAELEAVRALRPALRALLMADRDTAVEIVNRTLAEHGAVPQLLRHDGFDYHIHAVDPDSPLDVRIAVETAMAMIDLIRLDELSRLSVCADDTCNGVVIDFSRNRSRRFCSVACGNRVAAAAYRARKDTRGSAGEGGDA